MDQKQCSSTWARNHNTAQRKTEERDLTPFSSFGLGAVAAAAAGSTGPPGWFAALVGVGFASLAVGNIGLKAYELKLELDSTTKVSEIPSSAKIAAQLMAMIPVEVLMALIAHVAGKLGGKVGTKAKEFVRKWEEQKANNAKAKRPTEDYESYGSEAAETPETAFGTSRPPKSRRTQPSGHRGGKPTGDRSPETGSQKRTHKRENESADVMADAGYVVEQNPPTTPNGKNPDYLIEGEVFDCLSPSSNDISQVRDGISKKINIGQTKRIVLNLDDTRVTPDQVRDILSRRPKKGLEEVIAIKNGRITHVFPIEGE